MKNLNLILGVAALAGIAFVWNNRQKALGKTFLGKPLGPIADDKTVAAAEEIVKKNGVDGFDNAAGITAMSMRQGGFRGVGVGAQRLKYTTAISNIKHACPVGSHSVKLADGSYGCVSNQN
jgi:hypothetical protein